MSRHKLPPREQIAVEYHMERMSTAQASPDAPWVMPDSHNCSTELSKGLAASLAEDVAMVRERAARRRNARQEESKENVRPEQCATHEAAASKAEGEAGDDCLKKPQPWPQDLPATDLDEWVRAASSIEERAQRRRQVAERRHQEKIADRASNVNVKVFTGAKVQPVPRQGRAAQRKAAPAPEAAGQLAATP